LRTDYVFFFTLINSSYYFVHKSSKMQLSKRINNLQDILYFMPE